jgi:transcription termination factor NusB
VVMDLWNMISRKLKMITKVYKNIIELAKDYSDRNIVSSFLNDVLEKDIKFKVLFGMMVF